MSVLVQVLYFFLFFLLFAPWSRCLVARVCQHMRLQTVLCVFLCLGGIRRHDFQFPDAPFQPFDFWNRKGGKRKKSKKHEYKKIKWRICAAHPGTQDNKPRQTVKQNSHHYGKETSEYPKSRGKCMNIECWFFPILFILLPDWFFFFCPPFSALHKPHKHTTPLYFSLLVSKGLTYSWPEVGVLFVS